MVAKVYTFDTSRDAYDAIQVGDVPVGGVLHIPSEGIVGVADTWPFAVTEAYGSLHGLYRHPTQWELDGTLYTAAEVAVLAASTDAAIRLVETLYCAGMNAYALADWVTS